MKRIKKVAIVSIFLIILSTFAFGTPPEKLDLSIGIGYNAQTFRNVSAHGTVFNFYIADTWENNGVFLGDMSVNIPLQLSIGRTFIEMYSQFRLGAEIVMGGGYEFDFSDRMPLTLTVGGGVYASMLSFGNIYNPSAYFFLGAGAIARGRYNFAENWSADFGIRVGVPFVGFTPAAACGVGISFSATTGINYKFDYVPPVTRETRFYIIEHKGENINYYEGRFY